MKKRIVYSIVISTLLFSGCAQRENNLFKEQVKTGFKIAKDINISKDIKQISLKDQYIDFSIDKDLKSALQELSNLDPDSVYLLKNNTQNIIFPNLSTADSKKLGINTFYKLKKFVAQTTPYILKLETNPFRKGIKIVEVLNKDAVKNNIEKMPLSIHGRVSLKKVLNKISEITGYNIIFKNDSLSNTKTTAMLTPSSISSKRSPIPSAVPMFNELNNKYIDFNGKTIGEFLTYISNQFNYFINIDYQNKLIIFQKYKTFAFPLIVPNLKTNTTSGLTESSGAGIADTIQLSYTNNFTNNFVKSLKKLFPSDNIYYSSGTIYAYITKNDYENIAQMIKNFNQQFQKIAKVKIDVYAFLINKTFNIGSDFSLINRYIKMTTNYLSSSLATLNGQRHLKHIGTITSGSFNLNNNFIRYVKHYSFENIVVNNIPVIDTLASQRNYIQSIQTTTTTGTATSTTVQTNIGKISQGQDFVIFPKIYSNKIFLRILFKSSALDSLQEKNIAGNTIMLPAVSEKNIPINITLRYGERKIASIIQTFANANQFKGIVPLEGFIVGGDNQHQYVRELIAVVVSAEK